MALAKSAGPPSIQIRSLKNDQQTIKILTLPGVGVQSEPVSIESNSSVLICATHTFIIGYDLVKFNEKFFLTNSYSSLPLSLSTRWLAFVDSRLQVIHQSAGGINGSISEQYASYTGVMLNAAKSISKSVVKIGESVLGYSGQQANNTNMTEKSSPPKQAMLPTMNTNTSNAPRLRHGSGKDEPQAGIVTVIDTVKFFGVRSRSAGCRTRLMGLVVLDICSRWTTKLDRCSLSSSHRTHRPSAIQSKWTSFGNLWYQWTLLQCLGDSSVTLSMYSNLCQTSVYSISRWYRLSR